MFGKPTQTIVGMSPGFGHKGKFKDPVVQHVPKPPPPPYKAPSVPHNTPVHVASLPKDTPTYKKLDEDPGDWTLLGEVKCLTPEPPNEAKTANHFDRKGPTTWPINDDDDDDADATKKGEETAKSERPSWLLGAGSDWLFGAARKEQLRNAAVPVKSSNKSDKKK